MPEPAPSTTPQRALFEAITLHNPERAKRAIESGARWDCDTDGKQVDWDFGQARPAIWRYSAAMMALNKALSPTGRISILELVPEGAVDWGKALGAVLDFQHGAERLGVGGGMGVMEFVIDRWPQALGRWQDLAGRQGGSLLHVLADNTGLGYANKVHALVERGLDVNAQDTRGRTALHVVRSHLTTKALLECGADLGVLDQQRQTPLRACVARMREHARNKPDSAISSGDVLILVQLMDARPLAEDPKAALVWRQLTALRAMHDKSWGAVRTADKQALDRHLAVFEAYTRRGKLTQMAHSQADKRSCPKMRM